MFSKACEYGLRATIYTAQNSGEDKIVSLNDIASGIDSPTSFTAKILQKLVHNDIIKSSRGAYGGFYLPKGKLKKLSVFHIVKAIDGDSIFVGCALGLENCSDTRPCPVHNKFKIIREDLRSMLQKTTVEELVSQMNKGEKSLYRIKN